MTNIERKIGFLMVPGFALTSFSLVVEAFFVANELSNKTLYTLGFYHDELIAEQAIVTSSNFVPMLAKYSFLESDTNFNSLFVCAFHHAPFYRKQKILKKLYNLHKQGCQLATLSGGTFLLAKAGLLDDIECTVAHEQRGVFQELHPQISLQENLFTVNDNILSCAGGISALDMVLYLIAKDHGYDFARQVSAQFLQNRMRSEKETQLTSRYLRLRMKSSTLGVAVEIMESNITKPYSIKLLAEKIGTSSRTLENLFRRYENCTPNQYYLNLRLNKARKMVEETLLPFSIIAHANGFSSQSYFTKRFREAYNMGPRQFRNQNAIKNTGDII